MLLSVFIFSAIDSLWLITTIINVIKDSDWWPISLLILSVIFWCSAIVYDRYRFGVVVEIARNL